MRKKYRSDFTDEQWQKIEPLLPQPSKNGRPRSVDLREVINTILYQARTGVQWDYLPHDLLPKSTVWDYFVRWGKGGTWELMLKTLREELRTEAKKEPTPSVACVDTQMVKGAEVGGERGYDGGKKIYGTKRCIVTDNLGYLLEVRVLAGDYDDGTFAPEVLELLTQEKYPRLKILYADSKYINDVLDKWILMKMSRINCIFNVSRRGYLDSSH